MTLARAVLGFALLASPALAAEPYDINVVLPLTGGGAFLGTTEQHALQKAEPVLSADGGIGGRPVRFVFHDDQSSPQVAVQLLGQIKANNPAVILGSALVGSCNAMAPLARRGPVMYCFSPGIYPTSGSFAFSSSNSTHDLAATLLRYYAARGWNRVAVITSTDATGQDAARQIREVAAGLKGIELVNETSFNPSDVSAAAQLERMKGSDPQAIIAWSTGSAIGTVFKAMQDTGITLPVATTDGNMTYAAMKQFAGVLPAELYIPSPDWLNSDKEDVPTPVKAAKQRFFDAFAGDATPPDAASTYAWDPALLTVSVLRTLGPDATAEQVREALAKLTGFAGVNGIYDFAKAPQRGLDDSNVVVTRWDKAKSAWTVVSKPRGEPLG